MYVSDVVIKSTPGDVTSRKLQVASYITPSTKRLAIQRGELSSQHRAVHHVIMRVEVCALSQAPAALTHSLLIDWTKLEREGGFPEVPLGRRFLDDT